MPGLLTRLWWHLTRPGWNKVHRTAQHAALGELHYGGTRSRPDGPVHGIWKLTPPGFSKPISVVFPTVGDVPTPPYLAQLETLLADLDGLFERCRSAIAPVFLQCTETALPLEWRTMFRLDSVTLRPVGKDVDEDGPIWQITYWCDQALHWFVVDFDGDRVTDVDLAG